MNDAINLSRMRDAAFTAEVEAQSGQNVSTCYQCGNCTAGCPAGFVYDRQVNQIMRGVQLGLKDEVLNSRSIWMCLSCSTCSLRCPNNIDVAAVMETLRHMARKEGRVAVPKVEKFWFSFLDTVRAFGRTYEIGTMALYMMRSLRLFTDLDLAPEALKKKKLGFRPHVIPGGADAVARIMQRYKERAKREGGAAMKFAYYPGCSAKGSSADYEKSTQAVCAALGIHLEELPGWNCCGSTPAHAVDTELSAALCARNLDIAAREQAETVLTPCPSCLSNLRHAAKRMENPQFRARVDELLDTPAAAHFPEVTSVMQGIARVYDANAIAAQVKKSLKGVRLAAYYGCLMSRPPEVMDFGDPENPTLMESLLSACGAEMVDFPLKTACCGASFGIPERVMTARNSGRILELATQLGVDAVVVACPLCQMNLDLRQKQAAKEADAFFRMPVLYFTQMMGLAFGIAPEHLGLEKLRVSADELLRKIDGAQAGEGDR